MGFDWGGAASFVAGGPIGYGAYRAIKGTGSSTVDQVPLETPEQAAARKGLLNFAQTGTYGNYTAGTPYEGSLGDFGISALEQSGLDFLGGRTGSGDATLNDLLTTDKYDPLKQGGVYDQLRGRIQRGTREATDAYKRSSAFSGNLYSTDANRGLADVQARGAENEAVTMASLFDNYVGRKLSAAPVQEGIIRGRTQDAFTYGGLPRSLNNQEAQAQYAEFQRQRGEKQGQIGALSSVAGQNANFGVPSVSIPNDNPWMSVMNLLAQFGGKAVGTAMA